MTASGAIIVVLKGIMRTWSEITVHAEWIPKGMLLNAEVTLCLLILNKGFSRGTGYKGVSGHCSY